MGMIDRQARDLPLDAHVHTDLSPDSAVPIDDYARQAVERGIAELAITDHVDFAPTAPGVRETTFAQRERVVRDAAERWADARRRHPVRGRDHLGLALGDDDRATTSRRHAYDFVIGSVHVYRDSPVRRRPGRRLGRRPRRSTRSSRPYFDEVDGRRPDRAVRCDGPPRLREAFSGAARHHRGPRRRTRSCTIRSWRRSSRAARPWRSTRAGCASRPRRRIPRRPSSRASARWAGARVTVGSDAHRADSFAWALADGYASAAEAGFDGADLPSRRRPRSAVDR